MSDKKTRGPTGSATNIEAEGGRGSEPSALFRGVSPEEQGIPELVRRLAEQGSELAQKQLDLCRLKSGRGSVI